MRKCHGRTFKQQVEVCTHARVCVFSLAPARDANLLLVAVGEIVGLVCELRQHPVQALQVESEQLLQVHLLLAGLVVIGVGHF